MPTIIRRLSVLGTLLLLGALLSPATASADTGDVKPTYECTVALGDGVYRSYFGYENTTGETQTIPVGDDNFFTGTGDQDLGQPTTFQAGNLGGPRPGRTPFYPDAEFSVDWNGSGNLVWTLAFDGDRRTVTATATNRPCNLVDNVSPILECVAPLGDGQYRAFFGYENHNDVPVDIPVGDDNFFTGGSAQDLGQPTTFMAGDLGGPRDGRTPFYPDAAFSVDFGGSNLVWTLGDSTATASDNPAQACDGADHVSPILECVTVGSDGVVEAFFGYENRAGYTVEVPFGSSDPANTLTGPVLSGTPPSTFEQFPAGAPDGRPNRTPFYPDAAFSVAFLGVEGNLVWTLGDSTATASIESDPCPVTPPPPPPPPSGGGDDPDLPPAQEPDPTRLGGGERIETAVIISEQLFGDGQAGAVVLARQDDPADAVTGTPLAVALDAPVLLTQSDQLTAITATEIDRVLPDGGPVVIMGGVAAVSQAVEDELAADGYDVQRVAGPNRFATATESADRLADLGLADQVLLADGGGFVAATVAGPAAATGDGVVLLTSGPAPAPETTAWLAANPSLPTTAVGPEAVAAHPDATPIDIVGPSALSVAVAQAFFTDPPVVGVATQEAFPDPLAGGTHIAHLGGPLLLSPADGLPPVVADYVADIAASVTDSFVYGGPAALVQAVIDGLQTALAGAVT